MLCLCLGKSCSNHHLSTIHILHNLECSQASFHPASFVGCCMLDILSCICLLCPLCNLNRELCHRLLQHRHKPYKLNLPFRPSDPSLWSCPCLPVRGSCRPIWALPTPSAASATGTSSVLKSCGCMCTTTTSPASCAFAMELSATLLLLNTSQNTSGMGSKNPRA